MLEPKNPYSKMQSEYYEGAATDVANIDHRYHEKNRDYWDILLAPIKADSKKWDGKVALDFGCGLGRNALNLIRMANWKHVVGVDIAEGNLKLATEFFKGHGYKELGEEKPFEGDFAFYKNNGIDIPLLDECVDFVLSTIVFQHIAVHEIRYNLFKELYRLLKEGGEISIQMGFGPGYGKAKYHENAYEAPETNTKYDVEVLSPDQIKDDLEKIGFKNFEYVIRPSFMDGHPNWIFFKATK